MDYQSKYFKYKAKYLKFVNKHRQFGGEIPAFEKDGYRFVIQEKSDANSNKLARDIVSISVTPSNGTTGESNKIYLYRSNSEVGIWRLLVYLYDSIHKGVHYITSTFVDMLLQQHINDNYSNIPISVDINKQLDMLNNTNNTNTIEAIQFIQEDEEKRIIEDPIFNIFSDCGPGECFSKPMYIDSYVNNLNESNQYEKELKEALIPCLGIEDFPTKIKKMYDGLSALMSKYFEIIDTPSKIGNNKIYYLDRIFDIEYYYVKIRNNIINATYILFYSKYKYVKSDGTYQNIMKQTTPDGFYYSIINIIPEDAKITKFGVYDKIVSAGVYIYKILEYARQCAIKKDTSNSHRPIRLDGQCYFFIGDCMTNVWPLNILSQQAK